MTHLEILAARVVVVAQEADRLAAHYLESGDKILTSYCVGKANGLRVAADMLRLEALEREGIDREVQE